jgi:putative FmdB family regulatory protein
MPTFSFACKKCSTKYSDLVQFDPSGKYKDTKCPACGSKSKEKLMTSCSFAFAQPEGTDRWNSEQSGHDYRFHHKLPKVIEERQNAELANKGALPYNHINDLDSTEAWGDVK